jgi:hypothetical protein
VDTKYRCDVLIRSLWEKGTDCIVDMRVTDKDVKSYRNKDPQKVLEVVERLKKKKCLQPCLDQWLHFTPFVVSVDGLVGKESIAVIKTRIENQAQKTRKLCSHLCEHFFGPESVSRWSEHLICV